MHEKEDALKVEGRMIQVHHQKFLEWRLRRREVFLRSQENDRGHPQGPVPKKSTQKISQRVMIFRMQLLFFSGSECSSVFVIKACAGSAMLSSVLQQYGFETLPIDFGGNKHRPYMHVVNLDLRKRHAWEFLAKVVWVGEFTGFTGHRHAVHHRVLGFGHLVNLLKVHHL